MAKFEAAFLNMKMVEKQKEMEMEREKKKAAAFRVSVDASIGVDEMHEVYGKYVAYSVNKDFHSLICPTAGCPRAIGWSTKPCADWMVKVAGLIFELVGLLPNGKMSMLKNQRAIQKLLQDNHIVNNLKGVDGQQYVEKCDILMRVVMSMFRSVRNNTDHYDRLKRKLIKADMQKIDLVLAKMEKSSKAEQPDPQEQSPVPVYYQPYATNSPTTTPKVPSVPNSWEGSSNKKAIVRSEEKGEDVYGFPKGPLFESTPDEKLSGVQYYKFPEGSLANSNGPEFVKVNETPKSSHVKSSSAIATSKTIVIEDDEDKEVQDVDGDLLMEAEEFVPKELEAVKEKKEKKKDDKKVKGKAEEDGEPKVPCFCYTKY